LLLSPATWALSSVTGIVVGIEDVDLFGPSSQQQVQFEGYDACGESCQPTEAPRFSTWVNRPERPLERGKRLSGVCQVSDRLPSKIASV
jgi:hypothetical protein